MDETRYIGFFATGDHTFFLSAARTIALQREADCGIFDLFFDMGQSLASIGEEMVLAGRTSVTPSQCVAVIANGLIGGGMPEQEARDMVKTYCAPARPAMHDLALAWRILEAAIYGIQVKKKTEAELAGGEVSSGKASSSSTAGSSDSTGKPARSRPTSKRSKPRMN